MNRFLQMSDAGYSRPSIATQRNCDVGGRQKAGTDRLGMETILGRRLPKSMPKKRFLKPAAGSRGRLRMLKRAKEGDANGTPNEPALSETGRSSRADEED